SKHLVKDKWKSISALLSVPRGIESEFKSALDLFNWMENNDNPVTKKKYLSPTDISVIRFFFNYNLTASMDLLYILDTYEEAVGLRPVSIVNQIKPNHYEHQHKFINEIKPYADYEKKSTNYILNHAIKNPEKNCYSSNFRFEPPKICPYGSFKGELAALLTPTQILNMGRYLNMSVSNLEKLQKNTYYLFTYMENSCHIN